METTDSPGDALSAALLPVLMHQLNGATQVLTSLSAVLALPDGERWLKEKADDMSSVSREIEDLGWLLAVLSTASGSNLLLSRREERGLVIVAEVVRHALRREGRDLCEHEGELPRLDPAGGQGWELAWAAGLLLLEAGRALPALRPGEEGTVTGAVERPQLRWSFVAGDGGSGLLVLDGGEHALPSGAALDTLITQLTSALPGSSLRKNGDANLEYSVPTGWLR